MKQLTGIFLIVLISISLNAQEYNIKREQKIDSILELLTLEEKVAMCHAQSKFSSPGVPRLGIPEIWMSDGPHGVRAEINWDDWGHAGWTNDSITAFPALTCLAATFNPELAYEYGISIGEEARYRRKDILLGPGVNIYRTPLNGRNFEYMGEDPHLASIMVVPYIKGVQKSGVAACVKHYALNNQEKWRGHINVEVSDRALYEIYLPAFKAAVTKGQVWSVMGAYNKFRSQHTTHNEYLNNKILKGDWAFDGVLISDWGSAHDTREAALNGLDIEMGTWTDGLSQNSKWAYNNYYLAFPFLELLKSGEIAEDVVDDKVRRILRLMYRTTMMDERPLGRMNNIEHQQVAHKIATEGIVLLKNDNSFFPIDPKKEQTIAVIGENATRVQTTGGGSSELKAKYEISPLQGLQNKFSGAEISYARGYSSENTDSNKYLVQEALELAKKADIVLFIGGLNKNYHQDSEGNDRLSYDLPYQQNELIQALKKENKNTGVIIISGNGVEMPWLETIDGLIQSWYLGSESGNALADIISGDVNPSGKMPYSIQKQLNDNGAHSFGELSYPGDSITQYYKEDILVGYRWHDTKQIEPQFAFGHGLSYTNFTINNTKTDKPSYKNNEKIIVSYSLTNTGKQYGANTVQVYIGKPNSKVDRATKELKAFKKSFLDKNQTVNIELKIPVNSLAFYNESISDWEIEKGNYTIYIGDASDNIVSKLSIDVK